MKFTINIDCTPEEARTFFGFPDLKPFQDEILGQMQKQMMENMKKMDPQDIMSAWMPGNAMESFADYQKMMWESMTAHLQTGSSKD